MKVEPLDLSSPRMQAAIEEIERLIQQRYPAAIFQVEPGDDPTGMYVLVTVDVEDTDAVVEAYIDRLLELQIDSRGVGGVCRAGAASDNGVALARRADGGMRSMVPYYAAYLATRLPCPTILLIRP